MKTIEGRFDNEIVLSDQEERLIEDVKSLFASKSDYGDGSEFRLSFIDYVMNGYCNDCGNGGNPNRMCYCTRDD